MAFVGVSMYSIISEVAFNSVMLNPGPSRLVMNVPDRTLEILIPRNSTSMSASFRGQYYRYTHLELPRRVW
jgi:hypothetical protein